MPLDEVTHVLGNVAPSQGGWCAQRMAHRSQRVVVLHAHSESRVLDRLSPSSYTPAMVRVVHSHELLRRNQEEGVEKRQDTCDEAGYCSDQEHKAKLLQKPLTFRSSMELLALSFGSTSHGMDHRALLSESTGRS